MFLSGETLPLNYAKEKINDAYSEIIIACSHYDMQSYSIINSNLNG
jgi:hypothetical protein